MRRILLDANFFLIPAQFKVDIFSEIDRICHFSHELWTVAEVVDELNKLTTQGSGKDKSAARLGLKLLQSQNINIEGAVSEQKAFKGADNHLFKSALKGRDIVATQDMALKARLRAKGIPLIVLRAKKYLQLILS